MAENPPENTQPSNAQQPPKEQVLYAAPAPQNSAIPEEYLTDEDLYPAGQSSSSGGSPLTALKKKQPLIITAILGVVFLIIIVFVVARLMSGGKPEEKIKLTYWGLWDAPNTVEGVIKDYEDKNPNVDIEYVLMDAKDSYRERLIERTKNGTGPDIFRFHNTWVSELGEVIQPAPETVFTADEFKQLFYPVMAKDLLIDNNVVGVPLGIDTLMLFYNEKILQAAGVANPPTTWELILDTARTVTVKDGSGVIVTAGIALGTAENVSHFSDIIGMMFLQNGVSFTDIGADANAVSVIDTYTNFALSVNNVWSEQMGDSVKAFAAEKVAMIFAPSWEINVVKQLNPDISLKVISVPQITGGRKKNIANYWVEGVSKASAHQTEAWKFLKYLSEKETLTKLYEAQVKSGRLFGYPYPRADMADLLIQDPFVSPIIKDAPYLDSFPVISFTYDNGLDDGLVRYMKDAINKILQNSSSRDALNTMNAGFTQLYTEYQFTPTLLN